MASVYTMREGQYLLLEAVLPGRNPEIAGVLLYDREEERLAVRLRRDWDQFADEEDVGVLELLQQDLEMKIRELGAADFLAFLEETLSNVLRVPDRETVPLGKFETTLNRLYDRLVPVTVLKFKTHLPVYTLRAAAGKFGDQMEVEEDGWVEPPHGVRLSSDMFVATVVGRSMEPYIPDGSRCVFRYGVVGSRQGRLVLVENLEESEEGGQRYTVKRYESKKTMTGEDESRNVTVTMVPLNREYESWEIDPESAAAGRIRVLAEFVCVLD